VGGAKREARLRWLLVFAGVVKDDVAVTAVLTQDTILHLEHYLALLAPDVLILLSLETKCCVFEQSYGQSTVSSGNNMYGMPRAPRFDELPVRAS